MSEFTYEEQIKASHPVRTDTSRDYKADGMAMDLVGERHGKRELVDLVRWLITDKARTVNLDLDKRCNG